MRLHNRLIKAAFWTDTDLIRHLDRDGRMLYMGSIQLADDSGCLEDDPLAFKLHLYPGDMDVDVDFIQQRRDKLVEMGKFIPYESGGKKCLFIKNFHKHQALKNPAPPGVPLPKWLTWEPYKSNPKAGKYVLDDTVLSDFLESSYKVLTTFLQPEPEPEPNIIDDDDDNARAREERNNNISQTLQKEFGRVVSPTEVEVLESYVQRGMSDDVVCEAIKRARLHGSPKLSYVEGILKNWWAEQVRDMAGVERVDQEFEKRRKERQRDGPRKNAGQFSGKNSKGQRKKGEFDDFDFSKFEWQGPG